MNSGPCLNGNGHHESARTAIAQLLDRLALQGAGPSELFREAVRLNTGHPHPGGGDEVFALVAAARGALVDIKPPDGSSNVNQSEEVPEGPERARESATLVDIKPLGESGNVNQDYQTIRLSGQPGQPPTTTEAGAAVAAPPGSPPDHPSEDPQEGEGQTPARPEPPVGLPLADYLVWVVEDCRRHREGLEEARRWESDLFHFTRLAKAHPDLASLGAKKAFARVERVLKGWRRVLPSGFSGDDWEAWLDVGRDDAETEFMTIWEMVRYLPGLGPLENAFDEAQAAPLGLLDGTMERRSFGYPRFVSVAGHLQVLMGARPVTLPVEKVAELLEVEPRTVSRFRAWAVEDGYLREVRPAAFKGKGRRGRAAEYVFDVTRFECLAEKAAPGTQELFQGSPP